ncbi:MAG: ATP-binding protein [Spirochaetia bacterium]|nr:ATP-binding protein [Spirochaetia bacterium]
MKPEKKERFRLQTLSNPVYIAPVRDLVFKLALMFGFSRNEAFDLKVVCGEALSNISRHAYENKLNGPIFIEILKYEKYIEMKFRDFGIQKPIVKGLARDLSEYRERGLGLFLISKLTDYHVFDQSFDKGTLLTIKKRFTDD